MDSTAMSLHCGERVLVCVMERYRLKTVSLISTHRQDPAPNFSIIVGSEPNPHVSMRVWVSGRKSLAAVFLLFGEELLKAVEF